MCLTRRLNAHLASIASSGAFRMPAEVLPRGIDESAWSRLSSFGFSGTIAHGAFGSGTRPSDLRVDALSLYRNERTSKSSVAVQS